MKRLLGWVCAVAAACLLCGLLLWGTTGCEGTASALPPPPVPNGGLYESVEEWWHNEKVGGYCDAYMKAWAWYTCTSHSYDEVEWQFGLWNDDSWISNTYNAGDVASCSDPGSLYGERVEATITIPTATTHDEIGRGKYLTNVCTLFSGYTDHNFPPQRSLDLHHSDGTPTYSLSVGTNMGSHRAWIYYQWDEHRDIVHGYNLAVHRYDWGSSEWDLVELVYEWEDLYLAEGMSDEIYCQCIEGEYRRWCSFHNRYEWDFCAVLTHDPGGLAQREAATVEWVMYNNP